MINYEEHWERAATFSTAGSFSNNDRDGNENGKKAIRFISKTTTLPRSSRSFVDFLAVTARLQRKTSLLLYL